MSTREELQAENERLRTLNARLANQLVGMSDRLQASAKQIAADAWDEGWDAREDFEGCDSQCGDCALCGAPNPHRSEP